MARRLVSTLQTMQAKLIPIEGLNPEQTVAANHRRGHMAVLSQAGTGKTKTLIALVKQLIESGIPASRILAVTFSKKAADEMGERARREGFTGNFSTWHAFAGQILRTDNTPYARWTVDDTDRAKWALKEAIGYKHLDWKGVDTGQLRKFIGFCKAHNLMPSDRGVAELAAQHVKASEVSKAVRAYAIMQDLIETQGLLTFDDMLCFAARHLWNEDVRQEWAAKFDFVIQDEAQDSNPVQTEIAEALTKDNGNYVVIGDPAQSIYGFRGSSPEAVTTFKERHPTAKIVYMNRNYRCKPEIVSAANNVIRSAKVRLPVDMIAEVPGEGVVKVVSTPNFDTEGEEFKNYVQESIRNGRKFSDITCLFRTNAQSRSLEEALIGAQIPYLIVGGTSFYERKEVKDILSYLRLATDRGDEDAVKRCINTPFRFLGAKFVEKVWGVKRPDITWTDAARIAASKVGIQGRQRQSVQEWLNVLDSVLIDVNANVSPDQILTNLVKTIGFFEWLKQEEGEENIENSHVANVRELIRVAAKFQDTGKFLDYVKKSIQEASKQRKEGAQGGDRVLLMSIHRSKGLEWPCVWVVGLNEKIIPHAYGDEEEERRLAYVAMTRAREELTLSYVRSFATGEGLKSAEPSRFLADAKIGVETPLKQKVPV